MKALFSQNNFSIHGSRIAVGIWWCIETIQDFHTTSWSGLFYSAQGEKFFQGQWIPWNSFCGFLAVDSWRSGRKKKSESLKAILELGGSEWPIGHVMFILLSEWGACLVSYSLLPFWCLSVLQVKAILSSLHLNIYKIGLLICILYATLSFNSAHNIWVCKRF